MARVALLGVVCDLRDPPRPEDYPPRDPNHVGWSAITRELVEEELASGRYDDPTRQSFSLTEFAELDDGRRLMLREDRGFSDSALRGDFWQETTSKHLTVEALFAVQPDEGDRSPSNAWIVERLSELGIASDLASLDALPYRVEFSDRVVERLGK